MKTKLNLIALAGIICGLALSGVDTTISRGAEAPPPAPPPWWPTTPPSNPPTNFGGGSCPNCPTMSAADPNNQPPNDDNTPDDPVSMATGAMTIAETDLSLPGPTPIAFTRYYSSKLNYDGPLGYSWDYSFNKYLTFSSGSGTGTLYFHTGKGYQIPLKFTAPGSDSDAVSSVRAYYTAKYDATNDLYIISDTSGNQYTFYSSGFINKSTDRNGNELDYTVDNNGNVIKVEDRLHGTYMTFELDDHNRITSVTDSAGRTVAYSYDSNYCLTTVTEPGTPDFPAGTTHQFSYDSNKRLTNKIDGTGTTIVTNTYGTWGGADEFKVTSQTWNGGTTNFVYDDAHNKVTRTDALGYVTDYYNDGNADITKIVVHTAGLHSGEPSTYETDLTFDGNYRKTLQVNPSGNTVAWTYDDHNNILTMTKAFPSGTEVDGTKGTQSSTEVWTYTYESRFNQVASMTDPNGHVTTYDYGNAISNPGGNLLTVTYPTTGAGTATETYTYNRLGQVLSDTTSDGVTQFAHDPDTGYLIDMVRDYGSGKLNATTNYGYDTYGNRTTVQDPNGNTTTTTYNPQDLMTEVDGPAGEVEKFAYDANGHMVSDQRKAPSSTWVETVAVYNSYELPSEKRQYTDATHYLSTTYGYDADGNPTTVTDPMGHTTTKAYDERIKVYKVTDPLGDVAKYDFDANGNTNKMTDELSHVTTYTYDGIDRLGKKTFPDSSYQTWKYDAAGNTIALRTVAGNAIIQTFNNRNWMLTQNYGSTITNGYDLMGRILTSTEGGTSLTYAYDALGRNTSFTDQAGLTSTYTYDLDGNRRNSVYPSSVTVKRAYDSSDRLLTLKDGSNNTLITYTPDIVGRVSGISYANGTTVTFDWDLLNRVTSLQDALNTGNRSYSYVYNDASMADAITEPRGAIDVSYDNRNEVTGVTEPSGSPFADQSFAYDAGFNRSSWTLGSSTTSYTANNLNEYTAVGSATPTWNGDGSLATFSGNTYSYDALSRLSEVDYSGGKSLFSYDPMGRRVKKVDENGSGTVLATYSYHYDGKKLAVEYRPSSVTWTYCYGVDNNDVLLRLNGTTRQWYYRNGFDDVTAVADDSGDLTEAYEYNVQGQFQITNGSGTVLSVSGVGNDVLYTGQLYDPETGNYFYRARYYNPGLGRFISRDPLSGAEFSQGSNLYAYVANNPVNKTDPSGEEGWEEVLGALALGAAMGGLATWPLWHGGSQDNGDDALED